MLFRSLTPADARAYIREFRDQSDLMRKLRESWGLKNSLGGTDRATIAKWEKEMGFPPEIILYAAESAAGAEKPMAYLNMLLGSFHEEGVQDIAAARAERENHQKGYAKQADRPATRAGKTVEQQNYTQREYTHTDDAMDAMMRQWKEESGDA